MDIPQSRVDANHAARTDAVTNSQLIEDVRVENGNVGKDQVGGDQLSKHIFENAACRLLVIGTERLESGGVESRPEEELIDRVKVDHERIRLQLRICGLIRPDLSGDFLLPKRHYYEYATPESSCHNMRITGYASAEEESIGEIGYLKSMRSHRGKTAIGEWIMTLYDRLRREAREGVASAPPLVLQSRT